jgi:hypothetical protein
MPRIKLVEDDDYRADKQAIVDALATQGFECTLEQAGELWERFSASMAAGWLHLPDDPAEIVGNVRAYFEPEDGPSCTRDPNTCDVGFCAHPRCNAAEW